MKKILIALDYNPSAEKVAETGYAIAKAVQAEVTLVHVITDPSYYAIEYSPIMGYQGGYTSGITAIVDDIKKEAENFLAASVKHLGDNNINTMVLDGEAPGSILDYAKDWKADLVVMGSHRHHGIYRFLIPDIAVDAVKHSTIPLYIIPTADE